MKTLNRTGGAIAALAILCASAGFPAMAQTDKAQLYAFHTTPAVGGCPGLDWHVTLEPDQTLIGFVAWDHGQHVAKLSGKLAADRTFKMDANEVGGPKTAVVSGRAAGDNMSISITGLNNPCDGVVLNVPRASGEGAN